MDILLNIWEFIIHLDSHLEVIIAQIGGWSYLLLFLIIFAETGLVITPFLPGDSLLFVAGALAGKGMLNIAFLFITLAAAAILGDTINYWLGSWIGAKAFDGRFRFLKPEHLEKTHRFFEKHGGKAVILGRFVPVMRTFVPFVAGMGSMNYGRFITYNILGGVLWVAIFLFGGYFFGSIPFVQDNFALVIVVVIALSVMPVVWEVMSEKVILPRRMKQQGEQTLP
ncbi:MAG: DedA family protein [Anaerolineae bacterium]|nr:DedA family protein [Anaerolineae bacterium]